MFTCEKSTAVVILSYNSIEWHKLFLPKIISESTSGYEVYLVDHASSDDTAAYVAEHYPSVKLIYLKENHGFAWGYATALKQIKAEYYILLSADFEVTTGWFSPLKVAMDQQPLLAACQPKIRYYKQRELFEYAGAAGGFMDKWGYMFCRGRIFNTLEEDVAQYDDPIELFWASGGCLMVRASQYHEVGGLDEDLFAHMEEIDLCWRLKNKGYKIGYIGASTVFHVGGSIISYGSPKKTYYNFRNNLFILLKNEQKSKLFWLLPFRLILDGVAALPFLAKGEFKNIFAIIKAHNHFFRGFFKWKSKRLKDSNPSSPNTFGVYNKSIIIAYFIKGIKKFSDLNWKTKSLN